MEEANPGATPTLPFEGKTPVPRTKTTLLVVASSLSRPERVAQIDQRRESVINVSAIRNPKLLVASWTLPI